MRIVTATPDLIELRSDASGRRIVCAVMVIVGLALLGVQLIPDAEPSLPAYVLGGLLTTFGVSGLVLLRSAILRVDVPQGEIRLSRAGLAASKTRLLNAADLADVLLEESIDADNYSTFRMTFVTRDGLRLPFTDAHFPDYTSMAAAVDTVRARVLPGARRRPAPRGKIHSTASLRREGQVVLALLVFAGGFLVTGVHLASVEQSSLMHFRPVLVTVTDVRVDERAGDEGTSVRRPVVSYSYDVGGVTYTSDRVTPLDEWRAGGWARDIAERFTVGGVYEGYHDPADPARAFLLRRRSATPLVFIAIPLFGLLMLSYGGLAYLRR